MKSEGSKLYNNRWVAEAHAYPSTVAYTAGDLVGTKLTFADVIQADYGGGEITSVTVVDLAKQLKAMDLIVFSEDLATGTGATNWSTGDNAALDVADSDALNCVGKISISTGDYASLNDSAIATKSASLPFYVRGRNLYGLLVTRGTPTFADTDDLTVKISIERDN